MRKNIILTFSLFMISLIFLSMNISKSFAFDIVSSPTVEQSGLGQNTCLTLSGCTGWYFGEEGAADIYYNQNLIVGGINLWGQKGVKSLTSNIDFVFYKYRYFNWFYRSFYYDKSTLTKFDITENSYSFFNNDSKNIIVSSGSNLLFYDASSGLQGMSIIQTIPKPSINFDVMPGTFPVYLSGLNGTHFFAYQGTDGKSYKVIDTFTSGNDLPIESAGTGTVLPIGKFGYNSLILSRSPIGSGSLYVGDGGTAQPQWEMSTDYRLDYYNFFSNPKVYFTTENLDYPWVKTVLSWDMNCITPGYDSCTLNGGVFKCTNSVGTLSPGGELCGGTVYVGPPPSCTDGIKNQDETSIDFGGVCGGSSISSYTYSTFTCQDRQIFEPNSATGYNYQFGASPLVPVTENTISTNGKMVIRYLDQSGSLLLSDRQDYIAFSNVNSGSVFDTSTFLTISGTVNSYTRIYGTNPFMEIGMVSEVGNWYNIDYLKFATTKTGIVGQVYDQFNHFLGDLVGSGGLAIWKKNYSFTAGPLRIYGINNFSFNGFEAGTLEGGIVTVSECHDDNFFCEYTQQSGSQDYTCSSKYVIGKSEGTCGVVDNKCVPTSSTYTPIGYSGSINDSTFFFHFGDLAGVSAEYDCSNMFSGLHFLYGSQNSSEMSLNLSNNFQLADIPWTCPFLGADICGVGYEVTSYIIGKIFDSIDSTVNYLFTPVRLGIGYFSKPIQGNRYCFLTSSFIYDGKPMTYYDYYLQRDVTIGGQTTTFDWVVILIVTAVIFIILFK